MSKKNIVYLIISIVLVIVAITFCLYVFVFSNPKNDVPNVEISKTKDIANAKYNDITVYKSDGTEVKLSDYKDSPVVLFYFNKKSEDSIQDLKKFEEIYKKYEDKIKFFMINVAQEVDEELENEYSIEIVYDFYKEATRNYDITEYPSTIYIDSNNEVFNAKSGFTTTDALEANLDLLSNNI